MRRGVGPEHVGPAPATAQKEEQQIGVAIEQWHRLHEWADVIINAAQRVAHSPCWGCGAWMATPHTPWCRVASGSIERYLVKRG